ncbi:uncharacterized protein LOC130827026 isoform X2 [Amaranthus tricolor]|nr:uncharacterized protein LOC130827026 isoform X2 [Amaranthus tricolor]XP_057548656.1 uncharacterized protein LOC130827026 isoform X2 [Amaranthus tricolor]
MEVTSCQLIANEILPTSIVKTLLYPGAIVNAVLNGVTIPNYDNLLDIYNLTHVKSAPTILDLRHLEILAGCYFCVAGAMLGLLKQGRLSLIGMLLLIWGLIKQNIKEKSTCLHNTCTFEQVQVSPMMFIALFTALSSIKKDVRVVIKSFQAHHPVKAATELHQHVKKKKKEREMKRLEWNVHYNSKTSRCTKVAQQGITNTFTY